LTKAHKIRPGRISRLAYWVRFNGVA